MYLVPRAGGTTKHEIKPNICLFGRKYWQYYQRVRPWSRILLQGQVYPNLGDGGLAIGNMFTNINTIDSKY